MGMTFVEVMAEKQKSMVQNFIFLPRLPRMSFPYETWQALKTLVKVCRQIFLEFLEFFLILLFMLRSYELKLRWGLANTFSMNANDMHIYMMLL